MAKPDNGSRTFTMEQSFGAKIIIVVDVGTNDNMDGMKVLAIESQASTVNAEDTVEDMFPNSRLISAIHCKIHSPQSLEEWLVIFKSSCFRDTPSTKVQKTQENSYIDQKWDDRSRPTITWIN